MQFDVVTLFPEMFAALTQSVGWSDILTAYARCKRIVRSLPETYKVAPDKYAEPATRGLYDALLAAEARMAKADGEHDVALLGEVLGEMQGPITARMRVAPSTSA